MKELEVETIAHCTDQDHKATLLEDPYEDSTAIVDVEVGC
jgi:hypothetical protein